MMSAVWRTLSRRQKIESGSSPEFARVLGLLDLVAIGIGSTLGSGIYATAGYATKSQAGPATIISFAIAAIASILSGLCFAELAARVPKAGSAYVYSYVTVGEFIAFVIGWNLILEYVIGTASVATTLSGYANKLASNEIQNAFSAAIPFNLSFLPKDPDYFALFLIIMLTILLSVGVKESSILNNVFTTINLLTITYIIVVGLTKAKPENWAIDVTNLPSNYTNVGTGGFMPFGVSGVMTAASTCFYAYIGFDVITTTGEEAKRPQRDIPLALFISLTVIFFALFGTTTVLTMMWPYYDQDENTAFLHVFDQMNMPTTKLIVNIGAIFAMCASLLGALLPLPRILYAMANDGLIFKFFSKINKTFKTPFIATVISGTLAGIMALLFDLTELINMMSIGTLFAYSIVSISVLILRYDSEGSSCKAKNNTENISEENLNSLNWYEKILNSNNQKRPSKFSTLTTKYCVFLYCIIVICLCLLLAYTEVRTKIILTVTCVILVLLALLVITVISRQPIAEINLSFKVPLVPIIPCLSILINFYIIVTLNPNTWIRFVVWMALGLAIYFFYGIKHSYQGQRDKLEAQLMTEKKTNLQRFK